MPKSAIVKRSIVFNGKKTSLSLEDEFWNALKEIAAERHVKLSDLVTAIDGRREHANLSSAIRLFVLDYYRNQADRRWVTVSAHWQVVVKIRVVWPIAAVFFQ
jgi:predicted DNA-binding ribbon-helix-helix protein